jgi:multidrug resistance efflux pump
MRKHASAWRRNPPAHASNDVVDSRSHAQAPVISALPASVRLEQRLVDGALRIKALESDYRQQASDQLKITAARLGEIQQELRKGSDASARQVIVAPAAGEVMNLRFTSPGSVVSPREPIADIVPTDPWLVHDIFIRIAAPTPEEVKHA